MAVTLKSFSSTKEFQRLTLSLLYLQVGLKILADQFLAAPFFAITFIFGMGLLEDKRISECWREFILKFPAIYLVSVLSS